MTGTPRKIKRAALDLFDVEVAFRCLTKLIGGAISGRWLTYQRVETRIDLCSPYLRPVMKQAYGASAAQCMVAPGNPAEDEAYAAKVGRYRGQTIRNVGNALWTVAVTISMLCKGPVTHAFLWQQKATKT